MVVVTVVVAVAVAVAVPAGLGSAVSPSPFDLNRPKAVSKCCPGRRGSLSLKFANARLNCLICWRVKQEVCPAGRASRVSARRPTYLFCFAKRRRREKATPMMAPCCAGCTRRHLRGFTATATATATATVAARGGGRCAKMRLDSSNSSRSARSELFPVSTCTACRNPLHRFARGDCRD